MNEAPAQEPLTDNRLHAHFDGPRGRLLAASVCAVIALVAAGLRFYQLGRLSFWYDEVVTMRLARAASPRELLDRLFEIDATRAPLHPLLLQVWLRVFGTSEAAARSFSVLCGIATVVVVYQIARDAFGTRTGLHAAWLAALSPILVVYSREARMYAWLVLVTCLCWRLLLELRRAFTVSKAAAYVCCLTALVYSHPLGLLMLAALALAGLLDARVNLAGGMRWIAIHVAATILILPWVGRYFDHPPEFLSNRLPLRFLLGTPIGFIGGNAVLFLGLVFLIALGTIGRARDATHPTGEAMRVPVILLCWLIVPPVALYAYSWLFHPVFGPARYTAFVAPAYLVLVASGVSRLPAWARYPVLLGLAIASARALGPAAYDPEIKADWRDFAVEVAERQSHGPHRKVVVIVASPDSERNVEVETASYYLPADCEVIGLSDANDQHERLINAHEVFYAAGSRTAGNLSVPEAIGPYRFREHRHYPGLNVYLGLR